MGKHYGILRIGINDLKNERDALRARLDEALAENNRLKEELEKEHIEKEALVDSLNKERMKVAEEVSSNVPGVRSLQITV